MRCTSVVIADRHPVVLQGLMKVLRAEGGFEIVASCCDGMSCIDAIRNLGPDIAILDISMPGLTGLEILTIANSEGLSTRLVFFTASVQDGESVMSAAAAALLRSGRTSGAGAKEHRDRGECADGADGPRAADHGSGVRRVVEQGNWAPAEHCLRHHQGPPASRLSET